MAASATATDYIYMATAIRHRGISVTTRGVRCHGNAFVADDSFGGGSIGGRGPFEALWAAKGGRNSTYSEVRKVNL